jgi:hypothetical protein
MKRVLTSLFAALCGWLCITAAPARPAVGPSANQSPISRNFPTWLGVSSCTAAACHGNPEAKNGKRGEHTTWIEHDAHARAYNVLFNKLSAQIARNLRLEKPAHESDTCLVCHASAPPPAQRGERFQLSDGVSCESCHGPAEKWLGEHYSPAWKTRSDAQKKALGFQPTKNLLVRARACVVCHVGQGDADVNHDLLAAGHPPLQFEFSSYQAGMPHHWDVRDDKARYPDLDARSWLLGQNVTTAAALELMADRAGKEKLGAWPELAEFDCRACHHDLTGRLPNESTPRLRWNEWHADIFPQALYPPDGKVEGESRAKLSLIHQEMGKPRPDSERVAPAARRAAQMLDRSAARIDQMETMASQRLSQLFVSLSDYVVDPRNRPDAARRRYLGLHAIYETILDQVPGRIDPRWRSTLDKSKAEVDAVMSSPYWQQALPESQRKR